MSRSRDLGTRAESAVVTYLRAHGFAQAERRALHGACDQGDITGTPGICWEVKGGDRARHASDLLVADWMAETETERTNAGARFGVLVVQRPGIGPSNAGRWWAVVPSYTVAYLLTEGMRRDGRDGCAPVRLTLADLVLMLRATGYGDPHVAVT